MSKLVKKVLPQAREHERREKVLPAPDPLGIESDRRRRRSGVQRQNNILSDTLG